MSERRRRRFALRWALWGLALALLWPASAAAHSLGSGYFAHRFEVRIEAEWVYLVYATEIPTSVLRREFVSLALAERPDTDAEALRAEFHRKKAEQLKAGLTVKLNGRELSLEDDPDLERVTRPNDEVFLLFRYHLRARIDEALADENRLVIRNDNYPRRRAVFNHTVKLAPEFGSLRTGLEGDTKYAIDPRTQIKWHFSGKHRRVTLAFTRGGERTAADHGNRAQRQAAGADRGENEAGRLERYLMAEGLSFRWVLMALAVAFALGAGHALSPGHGKTVVAAYLIGSKGRVRDALVLGTTVTIAHTSSVFLLGLVALLLSQYVLPETLYPYLTFLSGLLIVAVGGVMLVKRIRALRAAHRGAGPTHEHEHEHEHGHEHGHAHSHGPPGGEVTWGSLLSLGISGGIVPCPSALVVLLAAIAYHRLALGLGMVVTFSLGLASVLIAIGVFLVLAGRVARRIMPSGRWIHWLPVASAVVIIVLGAALCAKAVLGGGIA